MTQEETKKYENLVKTELKEVMLRLINKSLEVQALMKDGKIIVAYEKFGGITKVLNQIVSRIDSFDPQKENL